MSIRRLNMWKYLPVAILVAAFTACAGPEEGEGPPESSQSQLSGSSRVQLVDFTTTRGNRLSVTERAERAGRVLLDGAPATIVVADLRGPESRGLGAPVPGTRPTLRTAYHPETDELLLVNGLVADDHSEGGDIGEAAARRVFDDTIARLARDGADDVVGLDLGKVKVSRLRQGNGLAGRPETLRTSIRAYVFSAPRTVNGLEVLNSNMTIGVHRSGKLASIHSRGVLPGSAPADPGLAVPRDRVISATDLQTRVQEQFPDSMVHSLGLVYVVGPQTDPRLASAVEPREVFVVFPQLHDGAGFGRGRTISYSVTDARAPGIYLDTQLQNDKGDIRQ